MARSCRFCGRELTNLCYRVDDPGEIFYYCECGSTTQLRRPPGRPKPQTNEWTRGAGEVSIKDVPLREYHGGYHVVKHKEIEEEMAHV
jgi:hypothetical protein